MAKASSINPVDLKQLVNSFFENNILKKEALRLYILDVFTKTHSQIEYYLYTPSFLDLWNQIKDYCAIENDSPCQTSYAHIQNLQTLIDFWNRESVSTPERFEFFVLSKAVELSSGDKDRDYYNALMIRHDQLLAATIIFTQCLENIKACTGIPINQVIKSSEFIYFGEKETDARIFEMAKEFYKIRLELGNFGN